jgi:hypothetical protein
MIRGYRSRSLARAGIATHIACALVALTALSPFESLAQPGLPQATRADLAPIRISGSYWIELAPVVVAANRFYPEQLPVGEGFQSIFLRRDFPVYLWDGP